MDPLLPIPTSNLDAGSDSPLAAQADLLEVVQRLNGIGLVPCSQYGTLNQAVAAIGSTAKTLVYGADITVSANIVIPATLELLPYNGAKINHSTYSVSYAGPVNRWDNSVKFNGTGTVTIAREAKPEWFVANVTPGTTNMAGALLKAVTASKKVMCEDSTIYGISTGTIIPSGTEIDFRNSTVKRIAGTLNSGPTAYMLKAQLASKVKVRNLVIDGNKAANSLVSGTSSHRFGGLVFDTCNSCSAENITVTGTVNAEDTCGVYVYSSTEVNLKNVTGYLNDTSAVLFYESDRCVIDGALFYSNTGSGVTSYDSDRCKYLNITAYDNGYSQVSVNGLNCTVDNIIAYNGASGYSGLNIGHDAVNNRANGCKVSNVIVYDNAGWGVTIVGSDDVALSNVTSSNNTDRNIRIFSNSTRCQLSNVEAYDGDSHGILIESGVGHQLCNVKTYGNGLSGIQIQTGVDYCQLINIKTFNNGKVTSANSGGIVMNSCAGAMFNNIDAYDDQGTPTQESGIWIAGGSGHVINNIFAHGNLTYQYRETSSPTNISYKNLKTGTDALQGTFTATAGTVSTIANNNARSLSRIKVWPTNAAAVTKGVPYISSLVAGTSFACTFSSALAGTETYAYEIE